MMDVWEEMVGEDSNVQDPEVHQHGGDVKPRLHLAGGDQWAPAAWGPESSTWDVDTKNRTIEHEL